MITIKELNETKFTMQDVHSLIKEVYIQRAEAGIHFQALSKTTEEIAQRIEQNQGIVYVAVDDQTQELIGTGTILFHIDKQGKRYAGFILAAVRIDAQGRGIGKLIRQRREKCAREKGCVYIASSTAENAKSSVEYHIKCGAKKYGFSSSRHSDYYSICFRQYLIPTFKGSSIYCVLRYNLFRIVTKMLYRENGTRTSLGAIFQKSK